MSKPKLTDAEREHLHAVKCLPCCLCNAPPPSLAHHVRDQGARIGHFMTIPVCPECHVGKCGIHGDKSMLRISGRTELQHTNDTIARLYG